MFWTFIVLLLFSTLIRLLHWPGGNVLLLFALLFPFVDIFIQLLRRRNQGSEKALKSLSALVAFGFGLYFVFRFLFWPGSWLVFALAVVLYLPFLIVFWLQKGKMSKRYGVTFGLMILSCVFLVIPTYSIYGFLTVYNPLHGKNEPIPSFAYYKLARFYHRAGKDQEAIQLLQRGLQEVEVRCQQGNLDLIDVLPSDCEDRVSFFNAQIVSLKQTGEMID